MNSNDQPQQPTSPTRERIEINAQVGTQAQNLFYALFQYQESIVEGMIAHFDPSELDDHLYQWDDFEEVGDLLIQLFDKVNNYASTLDSHLLPDNTKFKESERAKQLAYWKEKVRHNPYLNNKQKGGQGHE